MKLTVAYIGTFTASSFIMKAKGFGFDSVIRRCRACPVHRPWLRAHATRWSWSPHNEAVVLKCPWSFIMCVTK